MKMKKPVAITYCDFGKEGRKDEIRKHYSFKSALSGYKKIWDIYHRLSGWKVWQEEIKEINA